MLNHHQFIYPSIEQSILRLAITSSLRIMLFTILCRIVMYTIISNKISSNIFVGVKACHLRMALKSEMYSEIIWLFLFNQVQVY